MAPTRLTLIILSHRHPILVSYQTLSLSQTSFYLAGLFKQKDKEGGRLHFTAVSRTNTKSGALSCAPALCYAFEFSAWKGSVAVMADACDPSPGGWDGWITNQTWEVKEALLSQRQTSGWFSCRINHALHLSFCFLWGFFSGPFVSQTIFLSWVLLVSYI